MAGYIGTKASVVTPGAERKKIFAITTTTTSLTGLVYTPGFVHVYHNGVRLVDGTDYTATNGTSITLTVAAQSGDEVVVISFATFQTSDTVSASAGGTFSNAVTIDGDLTVDTDTLYVDSTNNRVGINTASPAYGLHLVGESEFEVDGGGTASVFRFTNSGTTSGDNSIIRAKIDGTTAGSFLQFGDADDVNVGQIEYNHNTDTMIFNTNAAEAMRITSAGDIGINTSSPLAPLHINRTDAKIILEDSNNGTGGTSYTPTLVFNANGDDVGSIGYLAGNLDITTENFNGSDIRFFTGGSHRMSLTTSGYLELGTTTPIAGTHPTVVLHGDDVRITVETYRPSTSAGNDIQTWRSDIGGTGTKVADVEANGDFNSATGNYATLSDERLKQDITPANSQWDDIKALEFKNYRMINLVETMGDDAPVYFGVIAQQLEAAGMNGLVEDKVDDDTQEVTKIVKTSILQMKAVKALQEAMERIEALEAEVAVLKGGA